MPVCPPAHCDGIMLAFLRISTFALTVGVSSAAFSAPDIEVIDDNGRAISLRSPARRVITLTPHVTEMVFAAGGGAKIVATVNSSDYPPEARSLPRIGDGLQPSPEQVAAYKPDLVIGWLPEQAESLDALDIPVFINTPRTLGDIADSIETFGVLLGTTDVARKRVDTLRQKLDVLMAGGVTRAPIRVLIQAGTEPEYALGADHILSDVIALCGGVNVFADSPAVAPRISVEGVLAAQPDLVLVGRSGAGGTPVPDPAALSYWQGVGLRAASLGQVYMLDADTIYRPGPRLIDTAGQICNVIHQARKA